MGLQSIWMNLVGVSNIGLIFEKQIPTQNGWMVWLWLSKRPCRVNMENMALLPLFATPMSVHGVLWARCTATCHLFWFSLGICYAKRPDKRLVRRSLYKSTSGWPVNARMQHSTSPDDIWILDLNGWLAAPQGRSLPGLYRPVHWKLHNVSFQ